VVVVVLERGVGRGEAVVRESRERRGGS